MRQMPQRPVWLAISFEAFTLGMWKKKRTPSHLPSLLAPLFGL